MMKTVRPRLLVVVVIVLLSAGSCEDRKAPESAYRWEGKKAFALWPEDDPDLAVDACADRPPYEEWRTDPGEVAERFLREVLDWPRPDVERVLAPEDAPQTALSAVDKSMRGYVLGVVMHLRRLDECWYVAVIQPREGGVPLGLKFTERDGEPVVEARWPDRSRLIVESSVVVEIGYGGTSERKIMEPDSRVTFAVEEPDRVGHYIVFPSKAPSENSQGYPLEPHPAD